MVLKQFVGGGVDDVTSRIDLRTLHAAVPTLLRQADQFGLGSWHHTQGLGNLFPSTTAKLTSVPDLRRSSGKMSRNQEQTCQKIH